MWHEINFYWWLAELPQIGLKPFLAKTLGICLMQGEIDNFYLKCEVELMLTSHLSDSSTHWCLPLYCPKPLQFHNESSFNLMECI